MTLPNIISKKVGFKNRHWAPLMTTNFLGVLNDNFLKNLICFISINWVASEYGSLVLSASAGLMVLPFIVFSPVAGFLSQKYSKVKIMQISKLAEIPIISIAAFGFYIESLALVLTSMFLISFQSCLNSPAKYGLIRDIGGNERISVGTGLLEMMIFIGVLIGAFLAGIVSDINEWIIPREEILTGVMLIIALFGWIASKFIKAQEPAPIPNPTFIKNPLRYFVKSVKSASINLPGLNSVVIGLSSFWLIGSMMQLNIILHAKDYLGINNTQTGLIMGYVAISIGIGCAVAGIISKKKMDLSLVAPGAFGLFISNSLIFIISPNTLVFTILVCLGGFSGGFFKVPLNTWIQKNVPGRQIGDAIAYNNLSVFLYILISSLIFGIITQFLNSSQIFMFIACTTIITFIVLHKYLLGSKNNY